MEVRMCSHHSSFYENLGVDELVGCVYVCTHKHIYTPKSTAMPSCRQQSGPASVGTLRGTVQDKWRNVKCW